MAGRSDTAQVEGRGSPELDSGVRKQKGWGHHAHQHRRFAVQDERLSQHLRVTGKASLPGAVTQHDHMAFTGLILIRQKGAPENGADFQDLKKTGGNEQAGHVLSNLISCKRKTLVLVGSHLLEVMTLISPMEEVVRGDGSSVPARRRVYFPDLYQPVRIRERQRTQQHGVDDTEHGGVRANAQSERDHGDSGETGTLSQHAKAVAQVIKHTGRL